MRFQGLFRVLAAMVGLAAALRAEVSCPAFFADHMVLQSGRPVPVWGKATAGERVTVAFANQSKSVMTGTSGEWRVTLDPMPVSREPRRLSIEGNTTMSFEDVLVGEVWFCSGQSNMEKQLGPRKGQRPTEDYEAEIARANLPLLRLFQVPRSDLPQKGPFVFTWLPCTPDNLFQSEFSAAAYYFGRELQKELGVPVGLIHSSFGGTRIEAWMPPEAFTGNPLLEGLENERYQAWVPGVQPTELYSSMVAPFAPFAVHGFLWYQGETNCMNAEHLGYAAKLRALITSWRAAWELPDAPFYYAMLAPFDYSRWETFPKRLTPEALPALWEAQVRALDVPHTALIVTTDLVDNLHDIHPTNKRDVGLRFARLALNDAYGRRDVAAYGPQFQSMRKTGSGRLQVSFRNADSLRSRDPASGELTHFEIAGMDRVFHPAEARIVGTRVELSSPRVPDPVAARFAWHETATPNLVNGAGLPAVPFRTDDWPLQLERPAAAPVAQP